MVTPGPLARHPRDLDLLLAALTTPAPSEHTPWRLDLPTLSKDTDQLRIAVWAEDASCPVDHATAQALATVEKALSGTQALVHHVASPIHFGDSTRLFEQLLHATATATTSDEAASAELAAVQELRNDDASPRAAFLRYRTQTHRTWLRTTEERARLRETWHQFFTEYDVVVMPAAPTPAIPEGSDILEVDGHQRSFFDQTGWTNLTSHVGLPSLVVPVTTTANGLPIGIQIVGPAYADRVLLALAASWATLLR